MFARLPISWGVLGGNLILIYSLITCLCLQFLINIGMFCSCLCYYFGMFCSSVLLFWDKFLEKFENLILL